MDSKTQFKWKKDPKVLKIYVSPKEKKDKKSKRFHIIKIYYQLLHIFGCLDFGFFEYKTYKRRMFWKIITLIYFITYWIATVTFVKHIKDLLYIFTNIFLFIYSSVNVLNLLIISDSKTLYAAFIDLKRLDSMLQVDFSSITDNIMIVGIGIHTAIKIIKLANYCRTFDYCFIGIVLIEFNSAIQQTVLMAYALIFILINFRLKKFVSILKTESNCPALQEIYKSIADLAEAQKTAFEPMFLAALMVNVPQILLFIYTNLNPNPDFVQEISVRTQLIRFILISDCLLFVFLPALCVGMLGSQTRKVNIILHDKLLLAKEKPRIREIGRFIHYVQERDCLFQVYQFLPLDMSVVGVVLNFCITYCIVMIQFAGKK